MFNHRVAKPFLKDPFLVLQGKEGSGQEGRRTGGMQNRRDAKQER